MIAPHAVEITISVRVSGLRAAAAFAASLLAAHPQWTIHVLLDPTVVGHRITVNDRDAEASVLTELEQWFHPFAIPVGS